MCVHCRTNLVQNAHGTFDPHRKIDMKCTLATAKIANVAAGEFPATRGPADHGPVIGRVSAATEGFLEVACEAQTSSHPANSASPP